MSDFCKSFRVESNTALKILISHVVLINKVHNVIKRKSLFWSLVASWYVITFWTQNGMNCQLCRIIRRDLGFIVAAHRFLRRENLFNLDKVEHWNLIVNRYWWETSVVIEYFSSWKSEFLLLSYTLFLMIFVISI